MPELTAKQKWSQLVLGLATVLVVALVLQLLGAKAALLGAVAAGLWAAPYIELRTTGRQPKNLAVRQLAALGTTIGYVVAESMQWA